MCNFPLAVSKSEAKNWNHLHKLMKVRRLFYLPIEDSSNRYIYCNSNGSTFKYPSFLYPIKTKQHLSKFNFKPMLKFTLPLQIFMFSLWKAASHCLLLVLFLSLWCVKRFHKSLLLWTFSTFYQNMTSCYLPGSLFKQFFNFNSCLSKTTDWFCPQLGPPVPLVDCFFCLFLTSFSSSDWIFVIEFHLVFVNKFSHRLSLHLIDFFSFFVWLSSGKIYLWWKKGWKYFVNKIKRNPGYEDM